MQGADALANQAEEIACNALNLQNPAERADFLAKACAGDVALLRAAEKIISECDKVDRFLNENRPSLAGDPGFVQALAGSTDQQSGGKGEFDSDNVVDGRVGPYKLLQKLGEGGCGVVFMAEQEKPVRRRVAVKVIKLGMDTKNVIARFEAERQALALMDHPNIAHVLDAGATDIGRPYFVMELVRGVKITAYCDQNRLDVGRRLELFIQICSAVQHAHQKGIVHRDLKPSNILVTMLDGVPVPKVIDFGIAKATGGERLTDNTIFTAYEQFIGTPAYMSPEQAQMSPDLSGDVDTRSDIYSLGVLLYELLTGKTPFDQSELLVSGLDEMRRTLLQREPHRPSTRLDALREDELTRTTICRQVETPKLKSLLEGDLDWIVMKALEKDRNRRYQTANGFAMDVQRYLNHEPVIARPPSRFYRLRKLVRRNRTTFAAISAVSIALVAGLGTSTWLFVREREARHEADLLRAEADARAKISQAALLISRQQMSMADQLVDGVQVPVEKPSLEAAGVFRGLGEWNIKQGRWKVAADRYLDLERATRVDRANATVQISRELLGAGPALLVAGESEKYRSFVRTILVRFGRTSDPVVAEEVTKNSLILPQDADMLRQLEPLVRLIRISVAAQRSKPLQEAYHLAWQELAVGLYDYRRGDFATAMLWVSRSLGAPDQTPSRVAMAHVLRAMAAARLNQPGTARSEFLAARELVDGKFPDGLTKTTKIKDLGTPSAGVWHEWVIAYVLLNEAKGMIQ